MSSVPDAPVVDHLYAVLNLMSDSIGMPFASYHVAVHAIASLQSWSFLRLPQSTTLLPSCLTAVRRLSLIGRRRVRLVLDAAPVDVVRPFALRVPDRLDDRVAVRFPSASRRSTTSSSSSSRRCRSSPARSCRTSRSPGSATSRRRSCRRRSAAPRRAGRTPPRGHAARHRCAGGRTGCRPAGAACTARTFRPAHGGRLDLPPGS